ncbi:Dihydrolipoyllysine-residue succinyltransferase [Thioalkalivibrio nitratireducens DSM 14787]|uniref:Acetyltransferase component of pyruvate dehydrogenase complex n=1 Tax=Thioalkalivibrio nitratireducens (strain DSM 14787 / UNIQEM 213 / ALEN2) TaxID=1255043 RepID=L0E0X6_THIND|nr:dihydrolipoyllysine-residue acetyltransferase [Thioalkalivibrio nitratireducens]AGA34306.1 Dihydrolipoyllysine-residue succinyltransferase [Thioalkalivibrio nitratireducens DSM 14787]
MSEIITVDVPDIGDFKDVEIIEVLVGVGDRIAPEDPLIALESDKASMEIPSPQGGVVKALKVNVGDRVSEGDTILDLEAETAGKDAAGGGDEPKAEAPREPAPRTEKAESEPEPEPEPKAGAAGPARGASPRPSPTAHIADEEAFRKAHASPAVRRFARELGVDLGKVEGSGRKKRILREDVQGFVKRALSQGAGPGLGVEPMPDIDFSQFGPIETQPLTKINKLTGKNLHRNWVSVPHVTQFDEADITELEDFRKSLKTEYEKKGLKVTFLPFLMKAVVSALKQYPRFNASLDATGENLIIKQYYHLGVAVDTPEGLVVPVVRDVDRKSLVDLARELMELSERARDRKLKTKDLQGGCLTISSLGGIGGTQFTPIVNAPEVAILGISRSSIRPVWNGEAFEPRLILPIALSYDHRVIDGALGARFTTTLAGLLSDMRRMLL